MDQSAFVSFQLVGKPKQFRFGFGRKFRPVSVSVFRFSPFSVFRPKHYFRPKQPVSAEIPCFGWFWPHISVKSHLPKQPFLAEIRYFGRNRLFPPKKCIGQNFSFGRNFSFSRGPCFGFSVSAKNQFRLTTISYKVTPPKDTLSLSFFLQSAAEGVFLQFEWVTFSFLPNQTDTNGQRDNGGKRRDKIGR